MNEILVPQGVRLKLGKIFGMSQPFIRKALKGKTSHHMAVKVRKAALENGGVEAVVVEPKTTAI